MLAREVESSVDGFVIEFTDCGTHQLKGLSGEWRVFEAVSEP